MHHVPRSPSSSSPNLFPVLARPFARPSTRPHQSAQFNLPVSHRTSLHCTSVHLNIVHRPSSIVHRPSVHCSTDRPADTTPSLLEHTQAIIQAAFKRPSSGDRSADIWLLLNDSLFVAVTKQCMASDISRHRAGTGLHLAACLQITRLAL